MKRSREMRDEGGKQRVEWPAPLDLRSSFQPSFLPVIPPDLSPPSTILTMRVGRRGQFSLLLERMGKGKQVHLLWAVRDEWGYYGLDPPHKMGQVITLPLLDGHALEGECACSIRNEQNLKPGWCGFHRSHKAFVQQARGRWLPFPFLTAISSPARYPVLF